MTTFNWLGGYGHYAAARFWNPRGVPGAGDTAVVDTGEVVLAGRQVGATVLLGTPDSAGQPVLDLRNASLAGLSMPNALPPPPYAASASPTQYGTVSVRGQSSIGSLEIGNFPNQSRGGERPGSATARSRRPTCSRSTWKGGRRSTRAST